MPLTVLTLNVWGLWLVSKKRGARIRHLCDYLRACTSDIVLLQEVWVGSDAAALLEAGSAAGLVHGVHFKSGIFGSGLVTMSRHPIAESGFWRYAAAGDPAAFSCGDFYAGKGLGWVRLRLPGGEQLDVFNTHLHANYSHKVAAHKAAPHKPAAHKATPSDSGASPSGGSAAGDAADAFDVPADAFGPYRVAQVVELATIVSLVTRGNPGGALLLGGDLNCKPNTLEFKLLASLLPQLNDAWSSSNGDAPGYTCKAPTNSWQPRRQVPQRIDYVLSTLPAQECQLALTHTPAGFSFSDHFAVQATLALPPADDKPAGKGAGRGARNPAASAGGASDDGTNDKTNGGAGKSQKERPTAAEGSALSSAAAPAGGIAGPLGAESRALLQQGALRCLLASIARYLMAFACIAIAVYVSSRQPCSQPPLGRAAATVGAKGVKTPRAPAVAAPSCLSAAIHGGQLLVLGLAAAGSLIMGLVADGTQRRGLLQIEQQLATLIAAAAAATVEH